MDFVKASAADLPKLRAAYIDIIEKTPNIREQAMWEYGKHPSDESLQAYISDGCMYLLLDDDCVAGAVALTSQQGNDYRSVTWQIPLAEDEVLVPHLLAVAPAYSGTGTGQLLIREVLQLTAAMGRKACRLDTLSTNIRAQRFYTKQGFSFRGRYRWHEETIGWMDFALYEYVLEE